MSLSHGSGLFGIRQPRMVIRVIRRRNSWSGFLTFWEQIPAAGSSEYKQYKSREKSNERRRRSSRKRIKWVQDTCLSDDCQRQKPWLRARPMAEFDRVFRSTGFSSVFSFDMHMNREVQWVGHLVGQKHRWAVRAGQQTLRRGLSAATLTSMPHALP